MSIKRASKLVKFLTFAGVSILLSGLAILLSKKQDENYSTLLDRSTSVANADALTSPPPAGTGDASGTGDGNDSGSSDDGG